MVRRFSLTAMTAALSLTLAALFAAPSFAGQCPKGSELATPRKLEDVPEKNIHRETLSVVKLQGWRGVGDLLLRTRRLTLTAGGFVPTHYHNDRPSIVYIAEGEIIEHNAHCAVPILHKAGEWTPEFGPTHGHWWEVAPGVQKVVILSSDVIPPEYQDEPEDM
jgi:hypothetical protein